MSEEKIKKKLNGQFFFLVGPDFSSSEESSTVKYSECALKVENRDIVFLKSGYWDVATPLPAPY